MRNHLSVPRMFNTGQAFTILVVMLLTVIVARGCDFKMPLTQAQKNAEKATLAEQTARWSEQRASRAQRAPFNLAMFVLGRLAGLVLVVLTCVGAISTLTLKGWAWACQVKPVGGVFPMILSKAGGNWQVFDANRQVGATTRLGDGAALVAPGWEAAQLAVTAGAQQIQAEQARVYDERLTVHDKRQVGSEQPAGELAPVAMNWPGRVPLTRYLDAQGGASLDSVFMGVTCCPETGQQEPVSMAMGDLVHFAVAGSSGFGKTTFVNSLLYQFVKSGGCDLAIVDLKGELVSWRNADALRWPIATQRQDGSAILTACYDEMQARKLAFEAIGGATDLDDYNARSNGAGKFKPLMLIADEGTVLLKGDKEIVNQATDLVLLGRSFGLWLCLAAQNFKVSSAASEIRDQLTTRVQFHAQDGNQARILLGHDKALGLVKGRAIARLSGYKSDIEMQAPIVTRGEIDALLAGQQGARQPAPVVIDVTPVKKPLKPAKLSPNEQERARELGRDGLTTTAILKDLFGRSGKSGPRALAVNLLLGRVSTGVDTP